MHFISSLSFAATLDLAAVNVQVYVQSNGADLSRLPVRAVAEELYGRDLDNLYEPDLDDLYERSLTDLYEKFIDTRSDHGLSSHHARAIDGADLFPGASQQGSSCSRSRSPSSRPATSTGKGIETTGICGCNAVGVIGKEGIVVAHVSPSEQGAIAKMNSLLVQVGTPAKAVVYPATEKGKIMDEQEVSNIKRTLGHIVLEVKPYEFKPGNMNVLEISTAGQVMWKQL